MTARQKLVLFDVDFTNYRISELVDLANQAKPFYQWIEKQFQMLMHSSDEFPSLMHRATLEQLRCLVERCMNYPSPEEVPKLYDGGGIPYPHKKACYFMFAWMARDAATQRLRPLISDARKMSKKQTSVIEIEALANLLYRYRDELQFFDWPVIREVTISRLEGSRRAKRGSEFETHVRLSLAQAFSYYHQTRGNYGKYVDFNILPHPLKIQNRTYDAVVELKRPDGTLRLLVIPVKTRETEGGGHAHLFTRDIEQANLDILSLHPDAIIAFVIVAANWSSEEIKGLEEKYQHVFYFDCNPVEFTGFQEKQTEMNSFIEEVLN